MKPIMLLDGEARSAALAALDAELLARLGGLPEMIDSRIEPLPAVAHVWACFHELESSRSKTMVPLGMGAMVPVREALPWGEVGRWMDERGIVDAQERHEFRGLLRVMEAEFQRHQAEMLKGGKTAAGPNAGETEGEDG